MTRLFVISAFAVLTACGGGGGGGNDDAAPAAAVVANSAAVQQTGQFVDGIVSGLSYQVGSGEVLLTDNNGKFNFSVADSVRFFVGACDLGSAIGGDFITPIDLVVDAAPGDVNNDTVTNIVRLLLSLDSNAATSRGIELNAATRDIFSGLGECDVGSPDLFSDGSEVLSALNLLGAELVSIQQAQNHLAASLTEIINGVAGSRQVDRMGRAAINTALIPTGSKDLYNLADDPANWNALFKDFFVASLNFTDNLDGQTGNTVLAQLGFFQGGDGEIDALADLLLDDRLQIDTSVAVCDGGYLAVEVGNGSLCGGRTLQADVIDATLGAVVGPGVTDFVGDDNNSLTEFPFIGSANNRQSAQVDRMGRAAINTALVSSAGGGVRKDAYNSAEDVSQWPAQFSAEFIDAINFTDSLDNQIGNTLLVQIGALAAGPDAVSGLAGILVDDRLTIDTNQANCSNGYFAVELGVANNCGGRTLEDDVIDVSLGALVGPGVGDFVADDNQNLADFPFIGTANN